MTPSEKLGQAKSEKASEVTSSYNLEKVGVFTFEVSEDKVVNVGGGQSRLVELETAYKSLLDVGDESGFLLQSDGSLIECTLAEWNELFIKMRAKGRELFGKHQTLLGQINDLTVDSSLTDIYSIVW